MVLMKKNKETLAVCAFCIVFEWGSSCKVSLLFVTYNTNQWKQDKSTSGVQIEYGEVSIAMENVFWHLDMGKSTDTLTLRTIVIKLVFICVHSV